MIIIFEGHDMTGKSNIAKQLAKELDIKIFKNKRDKSRWWDSNIDTIYAGDIIVQMLEQLKINLILDRFHGSEYAYARAFNRPYCENNIWVLDKRLAKINTIIIYCYKTKKYYKKDDHDITNIKYYNKIKKEYVNFLKHSECRILKICTNNENLKNAKMFKYF